MAVAIPQASDPSVRYLSTAQAYDLWSATYDTDGNFLQALDTIEMKTLAPRMLTLLENDPMLFPRPWKLVDLGCGTGRNTTALLEGKGDSFVIGLDVSPGMLEVAKERLQRSGVEEGRLRLQVFDMLRESNPPNSAIGADAIISTLVIEHIPTNVFFCHVAQILKPGGILLLTNMHSDMGAISQAGFIDPNSGEKIRPTSYAHTVREVEEEAEKYGLEVIEEIEVRAVNESMIPVLGERSAKWVGVTVWFGGIFRKRR